MRFQLLFLHVLSCLILRTHAYRALTAQSLITCMDRSQISASHFNVTFDPGARALRYSLDLDTQINGYVTAHVSVYAYGFKIIAKDIDLCLLGWKQFCPIFPGNLQVDSIQNDISQKVIDMIPGITYSVPDIDAVVKVEIRNRDLGQILSCLQGSFTNGKTVSQVGVKWATAVIAGLGLIIAASMSSFGNSNAASHIAANAVALFLYFQSVVIVCMQSVERVPPIALAWLENLAWSMGLIKVPFMQDIFRWYVQSTGGTPTLYFQGVTEQILVQRAVQAAKRAAKSASAKAANYIKPRSLDYSLQSNTNVLILRGIKRIGYNSGIEPTSIVCTGFTFFIFFGCLLVVVLAVAKSITTLLIRHNMVSPNRLDFGQLPLSAIIKGLVSRYVYFGFTQMLILCFWEFTEHDSAALIVLAVLFIILMFVVMGWALYNTVIIGRRSVLLFKNPAALLYGDSNVLQKFGFCYTIFHANKYWFGAVFTGYIFLKAAFISFSQGNGKVSVIPVFLFDLAYTVMLFVHSPFLNKPTNVVNYCIGIVTCLNSFMFMFFSDIFDQPGAVSLIMGWIFFVINAAFSLVLLIMVVVFSILSLASRNPDARFAPAKDDRSSFKKHLFDSKKTGRDAVELSALGIAAQDHNTDWETEMYKLNDLSSSSLSGREKKNLLSPYLNLGDTKDPASTEEDGFGAKIKNLTRGLSLRSARSKSIKKTDNTTYRGLQDPQLMPFLSEALDESPTLEPRHEFDFHTRAMSNGTDSIRRVDQQHQERFL